MGTPDSDGHGPPDGLPDLPPEWGRVVIPDDASALAAETAQLRREWRRQARRSRWHRRFGVTPAGQPVNRPLTGLPLVLTMIVLIATAIGVFAITRPQTQRPTAARPNTATYAPPVSRTGRPLPALDLVDTEQSPVPLRGLLPAIILLVDDCACTDQVGEARAVAPPGVTVVTVISQGSTPAALPTTAGIPIRALADPTGGLRDFLQLAPLPGRASALLVDRTGTLVRVVPAVNSVEDYRAELTQLASG